MIVSSSPSRAAQLAVWGSARLKVINGKIVRARGRTSGGFARHSRRSLDNAVTGVCPRSRATILFYGEHKMTSTMRAMAPMPTMPSVADDPRWARIVARDKTADEHLWYSVSTTGVYCRPSCPSRAASPENVQLHDTLESAKATGFRPCRRCKPRDRHG